MRDELLRDDEPPLRDFVLRDEVLRDDDEPPVRDELLRDADPPLRDDAPDPPDAFFARVAAAFFAAVLRFVAARLRVVAAFCAASERAFFGPPRARSSSWSATLRSSSTVPRTSLPELSPASAIARAARLRRPLCRSFLNRSLSNDALAIVSSLREPLRPS